MKICDKCGSKQVSETIVIDSQQIDLCAEHRQKILDYIYSSSDGEVEQENTASQPKRRGRPPKNS